MKRIDYAIRAGLAAGLSLTVLAPPAISGVLHTATRTSALPEAPVVVHISAHGGFDWGDAGIGAAGGFGLAMLVGGGLLISRRH